MSASRPYLVGLTGGIGSGKSTVARGFAEHAIQVIDADLLAHALSGPGGQAIPELRDAFGAEFITPEGALDRARMRKLAFEDDAARARLEAILHPLIRAETERQIQLGNSAYTMLVIPLLFESPNWRTRVDRALVVDCPEEQQIERVMRRSQLSADEVKAIMARQIDRPTRLKTADDVIDNSRSASELGPAIAALHDRYLKLAASERL